MAGKQYRLAKSLIRGRKFAQLTTSLSQDPTLLPGYDGALLRLAVDLTDRLLPAFDTPTGVPLSWVNLRKVGG